MSTKTRLERLEKRAEAADPTELEIKVIWDEAELPAARKRAAVDPDFVLIELQWGDEHEQA
jgi:hypothetical protein